MPTQCLWMREMALGVHAEYGRSNGPGSLALEYSKDIKKKSEITTLGFA